MNNMNQLFQFRPSIRCYNWSIIYLVQAVRVSDARNIQQVVKMIYKSAQPVFLIPLRPVRPLIFGIDINPLGYEYQKDPKEIYMKNNMQGNLM